MFDPIVIRLAGEPKGKGRPRFAAAKNGKGGRAFTPAATKSYEAMLRHEAQVVMDGRAPLTCALSVDIIAQMPIPKSMPKKQIALIESGHLFPTKKPDWDNLAKMTDALNEVVWKDDCQIVGGRVTKVYSTTPGLIIHISPIIGGGMI